MNKNIDSEKLIDYWVESSDEDFDTMIAMFESARYSWALFIGHLMMEKLLKAYFVKANNDYPPHLHNLLRLAELSNLELSEDQRYFMATVTAYNINARYDDYKMSFQKRCTKDYTSHWIVQLKQQRQWIKGLIQQ
jgi:HEPN domain-containing protein